MSRSKLLVLLVFALLLGSFSSVLAQDEGLLIWADNTRAPVFQDLGEQFEAEFGVPVEVAEIAFGDIRDQLLVAGPAGEGPDILIGAHDWVGQMVANGAVVPIDLAELEGEFTEPALNAFTYENTLWGVPYATENVALVRNVDLVPEAPATWEEVRAISEELLASGEAQYGLALQTGDTYHNFPVISAFGGYIFGRTEDGGFDVSDIGIASEGGLAAGEWLSGMYNDGLMPTNVDSDVAFALFEEGDAAMLITGPWFSQRIVETGVNYSIDPLPGAEGISEQGAPFLGAQGVFISAYSDNQLLAEEFVYGFFATLDTMQAIYDNDPRIPAWAAVDTSTDPNAQAFLAAGSNAIPMPAIPEMSAVWAAAGDALNLISQGDEAVATFENANAQIIEAIALVQSEERIVGVPGSYQAAAGCEADWNPACEVTFMEAQGDGIYTLTVTLPAGEYEYKVAMNGAWDENYGVDGERDGANIILVLEEETEVTFTYDDNTNVITDSVNNPE